MTHLNDFIQNNQDILANIALAIKNLKELRQNTAQTLINEGYADKNEWAELLIESNENVEKLISSYHGIYAKIDAITKSFEERKKLIEIAQQNIK